MVVAIKIINNKNQGNQKKNHKIKVLLYQLINLFKHLLLYYLLLFNHHQQLGLLLLMDSQCHILDLFEIINVKTMTDITTMMITIMMDIIMMDIIMMDIIMTDITITTDTTTTMMAITIIMDTMIMMVIIVVVAVVVVTMVDMLMVIEAILKVEHFNIQILIKTVNINGQHTHLHGTINNGVIVENQKKLKVQAKVILEETKMINIDLY
jgi:hypothetical protein